MMRRIANETTIHGIKEAWNANRIGRIFFAIVFITCSVLMFFQLKGIFQAYVNDSVGTRVTIPTALDDLEAPSLYYCNDMWYPNLRALVELSRSGHGMPKRMEEQISALHLGVLRQDDAIHPLDDFWRKMRIQDLINGIMLLPSKGRFDRVIIREHRPKNGSDDFYDRANREMTDMLKGIIGSSLRKTIEKNLEELMAHEDSAHESLMSETHGIFPSAFSEPSIPLWHKFLSSQFLSDRAGMPSLTLDGICWEFSPGPVGEKAQQTRKKIQRHVVTHFGGFGRQFSKLVHLYLTTYGSTNHIKIRGLSMATFKSALERVIGEVVKYSALYTSMYATYVSIATKGHHHLFFDQKMHIDSWTPRVRLNYWTKRTVAKSRKGWPCGSETWTDLDQAHCNLNLARERGDFLCAQYLSESNHFPETGITNETCIYDHTELLQLGKSTAFKQSVGLRAGFPLRISSASRSEILFNLTSNSLRCPRPCSKTLFQFETTYPTSEFHMYLRECTIALAYLFVPQENINEALIGNYTAQLQDDSSLKPIIFRSAFEVIWNYSFRHPHANTQTPGPKQWPCSVVEFERSESHGQVVEEYFLYSLSDLAANVGGTMGLWIGASVISVVQLIYLCCLKRLFKRFHRYKFRHLTRLAVRLRTMVVKQRMGNCRTRGKANLMNHIADDSTIHGVKEVCNSSKTGRIFFAIVFVTCFVFTFFQLKGVLRDYVNDSVGTRLTGVTAVEVEEMPYFNYCNDMWFPNLQGLKELNRGGHGMPKRLLAQTLALHLLTVLRHNGTMHPLDNLWMLMRMQDMINGIMLLPEEGRFDRTLIAKMSPPKESRGFYVRAHHEMTGMLKGLIGGSLRNAVENKLGESIMQRNSAHAAHINETHGIFPNMPQIGITVNAREILPTLSDRTGNVTTSLDGICWQFSPVPAGLETQQSIGERHRHVVVHFGGLVRQFSQLMYLYLTTRGSSEVHQGDTITSALDRVVDEVIRYSALYKHSYSTYVSISSQSKSRLLFDQKVHIDSFSPHVILKYWTKRSVLKSKKGSPCRSGIWTDLDQAHCNQNLAKEKGDLPCEQYLPASNHYPETGVTDKTCIYDHTGLIEHARSAAAKQYTRPRFVFPLQVSSASRQEVLFNLSANSLHCPRPCSKTLFQFETTHPTSDANQAAAQCWVALAYSFLPQEDINELWLGNVRINSDSIHKEPKHVLFVIALSIIARRSPYNLKYARMYKNDQQWPCSVVEFERSETHGQITEEYFLYSLSDVAASVGGTTGLWTGASIISIVQLIYLCCLKGLFKRFHRHRFRYLTRFARRLRRLVTKQKVADGRTRQRV